MKGHVRFLGRHEGALEFRVRGDDYLVGVSAPACGVRSMVDMVGTVTCAAGSDRFPPPEVVALFPGFVAARVGDDYLVECRDGIRPEVTVVGGMVKATGQPMERMPISVRLELLLKDKGLSIAGLADTAGMERQQVHRIVTGKVLNPGILTVQRIVEAAGATMGEFFADED